LPSARLLTSTYIHIPLTMTAERGGSLVIISASY
jgi:hypothetical protein